MKKIISRSITFLALAYLGVCGFLFIMQRSLEYHFLAAHVDVAGTGIPHIEEITVTAQDGERLVVWHVPPRGNKPVLLYFPGNADNLGHPERIYAFKKLTEDGTGLLAVSYRGEGGSSGHPTEAGLRLDALALYYEGVRRYGAAKLFAYGHSLGTGVAVKLAAEKKVRGVILEAPFTSTASIAQKKYWYVPVSFLMLDQFRSDRIIDRIGAPLLIIHGDEDEIVPLNEGQKLFKLAAQPKQMVVLANGGHDNLQRLGATEQIQKFVSRN